MYLNAIDVFREGACFFRWQFPLQWFVKFYRFYFSVSFVLDLAFFNAIFLSLNFCNFFFIISLTFKK